MLANILEFFQVHPDYVVDYRTVFELPSCYISNGQLVASTGMRPFDDMRYETGSSHSSASGYSDSDVRSRSSSVNSSDYQH